MCDGTVPPLWEGIDSESSVSVLLNSISGLECDGSKALHFWILAKDAAWWTRRGGLVYDV